MTFPKKLTSPTPILSCNMVPLPRKAFSSFSENALSKVRTRIWAQWARLDELVVELKGLRHRREKRVCFFKKSAANWK